jgi:formamidopyrimidine-DNA glycosylase
MPELPDLEVARRYVNATSLHQTIRSVEVRNEKILGEASAHELGGALEGQSFDSTCRHGKNLFVRLDDGTWLYVHFGMTGRLKYFEDLAKDPSHDRFLISFENGFHLALDDARMFGKVDLVEDPEAFIRNKKLGPDPLALDAATFRERFEGRRGGVKAALMNQQVVAGIGNIYSCSSSASIRGRMFDGSPGRPSKKCTGRRYGCWRERSNGEPTRTNCRNPSCSPTGAREKNAPGGTARSRR